MNTKTTIKSELINKDFVHKRQEVFLYRVIFLGLGGLLIALSDHLLFTNALLHLHLPIKDSWAPTLKNLSALTAFLMGASSLWISCSLRTSHELLREYFKRHYKAIVRYAPKEEAEHLLNALIDEANQAKRALANCRAFEKQLEILEKAKHSFSRIHGD